MTKQKMIQTVAVAAIAIVMTGAAGTDNAEMAEACASYAIEVEAIAKNIRRNESSIQGPGGRGQLPTRGSHGSGRAQFGHPAPQIMVSLLNGTHCARRAQGGGDRC